MRRRPRKGMLPFSENTGQSDDQKVACKKKNGQDSQARQVFFAHREDRQKACDILGSAQRQDLEHLNYAGQAAKTVPLLLGFIAASLPEAWGDLERHRPSRGYHGDGQLQATSTAKAR